MKDFELLIAPNAKGTAEGELYLDDGESLVQNATTEIHFKYTEDVLEMSGTFGYDAGDVKIAKVTVLRDAPMAKKLNAPLTSGLKAEIGSLSIY